MPLRPGPRVSNSAVRASSRQWGGSQAAARESYLQERERAVVVEFPQSQWLGKGGFPGCA